MEFKKRISKTGFVTYTAAAGWIDVRVNVCSGETKVYFMLALQKYPGLMESFRFYGGRREEELEAIVKEHLPMFMRDACTKILNESGIDANVRIKTRKAANHA